MPPQGVCVNSHRESYDQKGPERFPKLRCALSLYVSFDQVFPFVADKDGKPDSHSSVNGKPPRADVRRHAPLLHDHPYTQSRDGHYPPALRILLAICLEWKCTSSRCATKYRRVERIGSRAFHIPARTG